VPSSRERILAAAERVIAERGPGVPLREIAVAAGLRNNSAVQYYFEDRDGLVAAVVAFRLASLEARRLEMLAALEAEGRADDPAALVSALALPMFEIPFAEGATHYARFLEQVRAHPAVRELGTHRGEADASVRIITSRLARALTHVPPPLRAFRLTALTSALFAVLADRERALEAGAVDPASDALSRADVVQMLVGALLAPPPVAAPHRRGARARPRRG
jgi:AcrR family transcriptional regulator